MPPTISDYVAQINLAGTYENQVLYGMCQAAPDHTCPEKNAGKILLIGRAYSASPQRGAGQAAPDAGNFFASVGQHLSQGELDAKLATIDPIERLDDEGVLQKVVEAHTYFVDEIHRATCAWSQGCRPRRHPSFASKYLHFHRPNAFPLLDSRAQAGLQHAGINGAFGTYDSFCNAVLNYAELNYAERLLPNEWTLRSVDMQLIGDVR